MMTSIIGYTRVPFNPTCSIAPVKRLCTEENISSSRRPSYHRMFSREAIGSNGIMELIGDINRSKGIKQLEGYNTFLSIDISNHLAVQEEEEEVDLLKLMGWISSLAYENTTKLNQIMDLLKKLQKYEPQYKFMSRIDKQQQLVIIYFPNTISNTLDWLKTDLKINMNQYKNWNLHSTQQHKDIFDGQTYFKDIHKFIDQVDALIESNALFSHHKKNQ